MRKRKYIAIGWRHNISMSQILHKAIITVWEVKNGGLKRVDANAECKHCFLANKYYMIPKQKSKTEYFLELPLTQNVDCSINKLSYFIRVEKSVFRMQFDFAYDVILS